MKNKSIFRGKAVGIFFPAVIFQFILVTAVTAQIVQTKTDSPINEPAVVEILEKYVAALGGLELLRSIKTSETVSETEVMGTVNKNYRLSDLGTGRFYQLQETSRTRIEFGFDGVKSWRKSPEFRGYLAENDPQTRVNSRTRQPLYEYEKNKQKFSLLPDETIDGKNYFVLSKTTADSAGNALETKYYFDKTTYLLQREVRGGAITQVTIYDDYRKTDGRTVAFSTITTTPQATVKTRIISLKYNIPLDESKFEFIDNPNNSNQFISYKTNQVREESLSEAVRLETFEIVWNKINDTYWDKTFGGVDWKAVHDKYFPLVKTAAESGQFHQLLNQMLGELGRSHFAVSAPENTIGLHTPANLKRLTTGLTLIWVDSQLLVFNVSENSPAHQSGIRKGFIINKINGKTIDQIYADYLENDTGFRYKNSFGRIQAATREMKKSGSQTSVKIEFFDEKDKPQTSEFILRENPAIPSLRFQTKRLTTNVGYLKFNYFFGDLLQKFQDALTEFRDTKTLIIDLRGNSGGIGELAPAIASLLSTNSGSLGTFIYRYENQNIKYSGTGEKAFKGKIIFIVDEFSASTAEVLAGALQEQKRATVIGATTMGAVLPSLTLTLPHGGGLQYVVSNYKTPNGITLEGRGVIPDIVVKPLRADLLKGHDTVLEKALKIAQNFN